MRMLLAITATLVACAGPTLVKANQLGRDCYEDPETTGSLPADPRSVFMPGERPVTANTDTPEESWQAQAEETIEQRRQDLLNCRVD